jgi:hypothetical protein
MDMSPLLVCLYGMLFVIINEKQIMRLMRIAVNYQHKIELMIDKGIAYGAAKETVINIADLLREIDRQQSEKLREIE